MVQTLAKETTYDLENPQVILKGINKDGKEVQEIQIGFEETELVCHDVNQIIDGYSYRIVDLAYMIYIQNKKNIDFVFPTGQFEVTQNEEDFYVWAYNQGFIHKEELEENGIYINNLKDNSKKMEEQAAKAFGINLNNKKDLLKNLERFNIWRRQVGFLKDDGVIHYAELENENLEIANNTDYKKL